MDLRRPNCSRLSSTPAKYSAKSPTIAVRVSISSSFLESFPQARRSPRSLCRGFGLCFDVQIKEMSRSLFQRVRVEIRVDKISGELGVEQWFRKFHADAAQQMRMFFVTVHDHGMVIAVEQPLQALHHIRTEYVDANGFAVHGDHQCRKRASPGLLVPSA